ncbi:hypothetical protein [Calothrix sp. UHCC 0171]|uniref:hypothetical protein n=1 Tax=Calothrix sp. UHCC 0171 TaxID=3110245 RepID=UPI002B1F351F|nr:hypothetical protein [Calothrix sp. UHCC 0171]MEA5570043.1 hypothetical protein [Calothrix sp. UHCC 0171]
MLIKVFIKDLILCLKMSTDKNVNRQPSKCYLNPVCGCMNPGKEIACESCEYLESCLSRCDNSRRADIKNGKHI